MKYKFFMSRRAHAAAVAEVHVAAWHETYTGLIPQSYLDGLSLQKRTALWTKMITEPLRHSHHRVVANADQKDQVVGFVSAGPLREPVEGFRGEVYALYLLKAHQRQGLGKRLLLDSFEQLYRDGFQSAVVWVLENNPTRGFYAALGGVEVARKTADFGGEGLIEVAYGWSDLLSTIKQHRPQLRHPNVKHYGELEEDDHSHYYPDSTEALSIGSPLARELGLRRIGVHHELLPPGRRTSYPHAEEDEEELIYVLEGTPDVWIDGTLYRLKPGDTVAFPSGTGCCHTFQNNSSTPARLLVIGEASKPNSRVYYPLNPERRAQIGAAWWEDVPGR